MMRRNLSVVMTIGIVLCAFALVGGGCISITGESQEPDYFVLGNPSENSRSETDLLDGKSFFFRQTEIPSYLDGTRIVTRTSGNQLTYAEFDRWSETLDIGVTRAVADNLAAALGTLNYSYYPNRTRPNNLFEISITAQRFERVGATKVVFEGSWRLFHKQEQKLILPLKETVAVNGPGHGSAVKAMGVLLEDITERISERIQTYLQEQAALDTP